MRGAQSISPPPESNIAGLRDDEEDLGDSTLKVFLMTNQDRFKQYFMRHVGDELIFEEHRVISTAASGEPNASESLKYVRCEQSCTLSQVRATSIDSPERRALCKMKRHFCIALREVGGENRKLYFMTHEKMLEGFRFILAAQGF